MSDAAAAARLRAALELYEVGEAMLRQRLLREEPALTEAQLDERVGVWLRTRPGAEHGDHPGPPSSSRRL